MILVDTSVWIDFFSNRNAAHVMHLSNLIEQQEDLCLCGVILTEILQGIKNPKEKRLINNTLHSLIFLEMNRDTFVLAADIFSDLRKRGITIRKTIDCIIAAVAIDYKIPLIHNDCDFNSIEKYCGLRAVNTSLKN